MIEYHSLPEFDKELKHLLKKYSSLEEDFSIARRAAIELYHLKGIDNQSVFQIAGVQGKEKVYKLKKFACKSLKGKGNRSGIRIIYAYNDKTKMVTFLEMYVKGEKANEDAKRITAYLKSLEALS